MRTTVIHRNRTFRYNGREYQVSAGRDFDGVGRDISIHNTGTGAAVANGFDTLRDVRRFVDECRQHGWPLEEDPDGDYAHHRVWNHGK